MLEVKTDLEKFSMWGLEGATKEWGKMEKSWYFPKLDIISFQNIVHWKNEERTNLQTEIMTSMGVNNPIVHAPVNSSTSYSVKYKHPTNDKSHTVNNLPIICTKKCSSYNEIKYV